MAFILTQEGYLQILATDLSIADLLTKDHDLLDGLDDDDHTQYVLADGSRKMTGELEIAVAGGGQVLELRDSDGASADDCFCIIRFRYGATTNYGYIGAQATDDDDMTIQAQTGGIQFLTAGVLAAKFTDAKVLDLEAGIIGQLDEPIPEVIQQDAEPGTTYPGLIWVDTDADPGTGVVQSRIQDEDGDTKIQCEESADEDIIRFDVAGTEIMNIGAAVNIISTGTHLGLEKTTESVYLDLAYGRQGVGTCFIDFVTDEVYTDFGARLIRSGGEDGITQLSSRGDGSVRITAIDTAEVMLQTEGVTRLLVSEVGEVTKPYQPAFHVYTGATWSNIPINTENKIVFDEERNNVGGHFDKDVGYDFTAPVSGFYHLETTVRVDSVDVSAGYYRININTSNLSIREIHSLDKLAGDPPYWSLTCSATMWMDKDDTAHVVIYQSGGLAQSDVIASANYSWFTGYLVG
jgi:hypothetical protein